MSRRLLRHPGPRERRVLRRDGDVASVRSLRNTSSTASDTAVGVSMAPEATPSAAHRAMCSKALMSKFVPVPASAVGPTKILANPTSGCSTPTFDHPVECRLRRGVHADARPRRTDARHRREVDHRTRRLLEVGQRVPGDQRRAHDVRVEGAPPPLGIGGVQRDDRDGTGGVDDVVEPPELRHRSSTTCLQSASSVTSQASPIAVPSAPRDLLARILARRRTPRGRPRCRVAGR